MIEQQISHGTVELTSDIFDRAVSSNGGFSHAQLALLGVDGPPKKGWKRRLLGTFASREVVAEFIALKDKHLLRSRRKSAQKRPLFVTVDCLLTWKEQYRHPNWQRMRLHILNRDNFTCQRCGNHHRLLHVHHTSYLRNGFIWEVDSETLETLCDICHSLEHNRDLIESE